MRKFGWSTVVVVLAGLAFSAGCEGTISDPGAGPGGPGPGPGPGGVGDVRLGRRVWRVSPQHYASELGRLFGEGVPAVDLPGSAPDHYITDIAASARIDIGNAGQFVSAARTVAEWVTTNPAATRCTEYGTDACVDTILGWLPAEAYRRPVASSETDALRLLFDELRVTYDYDYAFAALVRAVLLAPDFLYRTELGADGGDGALVPLTSHEIATLLAFSITDRGPDAELLAAADRGELASPDAREAQARRLMADSKPMWQRFFWEWLHMATLDSQGAEVGLPAPVVAQIREEYEAFVGDVIVDGDGTLRSLFTATHTWARPELAAHYGATHPGGTGLERIDLVPEQRGGLLTRMAWLVAHGKDGRDNVVRRGMGIYIDAMCNDIRPPDGIDVVAELERLVPPDATVKEIVIARGGAGTCGGCHRLPDPVGLVFESFANDGTWQTTYAFDGLPVETDVQVGDLGTFDDATSLSAAFAENAEFQECLVQRLVHYMVGVDVGSPSRVVWTRDAHDAFVAGDTSFEELLVAIVRHPAFIERRR